jgi:membrane protein
VAPLKNRRPTALATWIGSRYPDSATSPRLLRWPLAFLARYSSRQGMLLASAAAFRLFLWLMPLALLVAGLLAAFAIGHTGDLRSAAKSAGITGAASQNAINTLREGERSWQVAVVTGGALFLWTTRTLMRNLTVVHAHAWQVPLPKPRHRVVVMTTLLFAVGWIAIFGVSAAIAPLAHVGLAGVVLGLILQGLVTAAAWLVISLRLPDGRNSWTDLIPGCLLVGFGLAILHLVSRVYIPRRLDHSSELYGALGIGAVILAWLLIIGQVIVGAAFVNSMWAEHRAQNQDAR